MSNNGEVIEKSSNVEMLIQEKQESNYFYGNQDVELDVADFISKSAPKQVKQNPFLESYLIFAKVYGTALVIYGLCRLVYLLYNATDFLPGGKYYYTFHHLFVIVNDLTYFAVGGYSIYTAYSCTTAKVASGYAVTVEMLLALFVFDSLDVAYLAHKSRVYDQYWEWFACIILYLFAYVNHYDFHKRFKKSNFWNVLLTAQ